MWSSVEARGQLLDARPISQRAWTELKEGNAEQQRRIHQQMADENQGSDEARYTAFAHSPSEAATCIDGAAPKVARSS